MKLIKKAKIHKKFILAFSLITIMCIFLVTIALFSSISVRNNLINIESIREKEHYETVLNNVFKKFETVKVYTEVTGVDNLNNENFNDFCASSEFNDIGFVSFSVAPDGVMQYYCSDSYENNLIGRDLVNDEREHVRDAVAYAIENNVIVIDGPFDLLQGGYGLVFRRAIYEDGEFAAIINLVVQVSQLSTQFERMQSDVVEVGVYTTDNELIFGNLVYKEDLSTISDFNIDNVDWRIGVEVTSDFTQKFLLLDSIIVSLSIVIYILGMLSITKYYLNNKSLILLQERLINFDALTSLPNRRLLSKDIEEYIKNNQPFFLGFGDLDNFKNLNDILGHSIGDRYLQDMSKNLSNQFSKLLKVYRWGGDEFIFVIRTDEKTEAIECLNKIYEIFEIPIVISEVDYKVSISIGIVKYPRHGLTVDDLIKRADIVMHDIKSQQKNTYAFFETKYLDNLQREIDFDNKMSKYSLNDFKVYLQPILHTKTNEIYGFEALSRLFDENGKVINTIDTIKFLERKGEIPKLDIFVFDTICKFSNELKKQFNKEYYFSCNVSPVTLSEKFVDYVEARVIECNINPNKIIIEVIETIGFKNIDESIVLLERLKAIGFQIAMDDFGMGYSSLSYITKLPLSIIKIDRYFVKNYNDNEFDRLLIIAIKDISKSLNLKIVVEGIETDKQLAFIKSIGAQYYQGYLHSKPMSLTDIIKRIKKGF